MSIQVIAVLSTLAVAVLARPSDVPGYGDPTPSYQAPSYHAPKSSYHVPDQYANVPAHYSYNYDVQDDYSGNHFGAQEARDGYNTEGSYYVQLPDGRLQKVTYYVNGDSGYVADVNYEGEARYSDSYDKSPSYGHAATPSYAPKPAYGH